MTNKETQIALSSCQSFEDFDKIMNGTWCKTDGDKCVYLHQLFNIELVHTTSKNKHTDYVAMANTVMKHCA